MGAPQTLYRYPKLNQIRLLKVEGNFEERVLSLVRVNLDDAPPYESLSYVWGSKVRDRLLHLRDGACLAVTENLEQLLPHVLRHCSTGYLWIDQICINQEDISERNHQVELMGDIYGGCKQVLVWLKDFLPVSVDAIHHVARLCHAANDTSVAEYTLIGKLHWMMFVDISEHSSLVLWQIFRYLCSSWFVRGWVYQEVVLAPVCRIILGHSTVSLPGLQLIWKTIWRTILRAQISPGFPPYDNKIVHGLKMIQKLNKDWEHFHQFQNADGPTGWGFEGLLSEVAPLIETSDPKDRIYALLGLNRDPEIQIQPNYRYSVEEVFIDTTRSIIEGKRRLDIFEFLLRETSERDTQPRRPPSWVPEFDRPAQLSRHFSKSLAGDNFYPHMGSCEGTELTVHGRSLEIIRYRVHRSFGLSTQLDFHHFVESAQKAWELTTQEHPPPTSKSVFAALVAQGHCVHEEDGKLLEMAEDVELHNWLSAVVKGQPHNFYWKSFAKRNSVPQSAHGRMEEALSAIWKIAFKRTLFVTESGRLALGATLKAGDEICILHGCSNPVALRPAGNGKHYVQETCFLEDWMDPWGKGKIDWQVAEASRFVLV